MTETVALGDVVMGDREKAQKPARTSRKATGGARARAKPAAEAAGTMAAAPDPVQSENDREKQQIEEARQAYLRKQVLDIYVVQADAASGNWIGEPKPTGHRTTAWDWSKKEDTGTEHYRTYVHHDVDDQEERAIVLQWVFH